jgi:hypothetical protein
MFTRTLEYVPSSEVLAHFLPQQNIAQFYSNWRDTRSWGDTVHSLVGSNEFLSTLQSFLQWLNIGVDLDKIEQEYRTLVGDSTFVDLAT